ncbi:MAG TPA: dihydroorotate dehydrogenase electron transfer subunit, partial [Anaerovoracaceae bacterium]|nr:dihydroorotate dehydrogenase electron transfer subunit [Anaerovoracaceae bacterium]
TEIADRIYRITLQSDAAAFANAGPGQFINLYLRDKSMLLPRPISICFMEKDQITLVYRAVGKGTKEISTYREEDFIQISTPLGQGYYIDEMFKTLDAVNSETKTIALVAGGVGVPPMVELAKAIQKRLVEDNPTQRQFADGSRNKIMLVSMMGFQQAPFLIEELMNYCDEVHIAAENGTAGFHGNVLEMMETRKITADYFLACGPKPMLKALAGICEKIDKPLQVSMEERMGCGYGACVGCTCKTKSKSDGIIKIKQKKVCKDGPVFFGDEVVWNE